MQQPPERAEPRRSRELQGLDGGLTGEAWRGSGGRSTRNLRKLLTRYEKMLAKETWQQIFMYVPHGDLCQVVRTSKYMNGVASWPNLWKGMTVNMKKVRAEGLAQLYNIDRYKKIEKMDFSGILFTSEELEVIMNEISGSPLQDLNFRNVNLSEGPGDLLSKAISRLSKVDLSYTKLTTVQCVELLEACSVSSSLVNVDMASCNLSEVPADLLSKAVSSLITVNLSSTELTTAQCVKLLEACISSNSLVSVDLAWVDLSEVPADLLSKAVSSLSKVDLSYTKLTTVQCVELLEACISSNSLVNVDLKGVNLSEVPPDLLSKAVSSLTTVNLYYNKLTTVQCVQLLEACISSNSLVNVDLKCVNLSEVPADLLSKAVSSLITVNLSYTELTTAQCVKLLEACSVSSSLVNVYLASVNLSKVPADLLSKAVSRLSTVDLSYTELTTVQCVELLEACSVSSSLVNVDMASINLSEVPSDLLSKAVSCLSNARWTYFSPD